MRMHITGTNKQIWMDLFKSAQAFRDQKPWEWMTDQDMFGVQDPATGEIGYCCVMGAAREVFGLGIYLGKEGFLSYLKLLDFDTLEEPDKMAIGLGQYMLKVEFVNREEVNPQDKEAFKKLGLKFRGKNQWIQIREMLPGYYPWYLTEEQAIFTTQVLWQAMEIAERFKNYPEILTAEREKLLVKVPQEKAGELIWADKYYLEPEIIPNDSPPISIALISKALKELPRKEAAICFSLQYFPAPIDQAQGEDRPFFSQIALWITYGSAYILGFETFSPKVFKKNFNTTFFQKLHSIGIIPSQIIVNSMIAGEAIEPICKALDIQVIFDPDIPDFQEIEAFMDQVMEGFL